MPTRKLVGRESVRLSLRSRDENGAPSRSTGGHLRTRSEGLDGPRRRAYDPSMVDAAHISQQTIDAAVDEAIAAVLSGDLASEPHLARAVIAERISAVAHHRSRDEVSAACDVDGASWDDIGHAFGMSPKNAHEHFGTKPSGLPQ